MARRCSCAGTCSCSIIAGSGIGISGTGSANSPYVIDATGNDIGDSIEFHDTPTVTFSVTGAGSSGDPYIVEAETTPVPPGTVNVGLGLVGDGSGPNPLAPAVSGVWGSVPLNTYGADSTVGREIYIDSDGQLRTRPIAAGDVPDLPASKITSGTLNAARIPTLDGSKIATGTVAAARVANLDASKITSGTFAEARIPPLPVSKVNGGVWTGAVDVGTGGNRARVFSGQISIGSTALIQNTLNMNNVATFRALGSDAVINGSDEVILVAGGGTGVVSVQPNGRIQAMGIYDSTTGSSPNVFITTEGRFSRSTSSIRYKTAVEEARRIDAVLDIVPKTWLPKDESDRSSNPDGSGRRFGAIAEELHALGLTELVVYKDGEPEAIAYDRVALALIPHIKSLVQVVEEQGKRIKALESSKPRTRAKKES